MGDDGRDMGAYTYIYIYIYTYTELPVVKPDFHIKRTSRQGRD